MKNFIYEVQPSRVLFGTRMLQQIKEECTLLNFTKVLVISTPGHIELAQKVTNLIGDNAFVHAKAVQHVPNNSVEKAIEVLKQLNIDGLVAIGGGSPIGLAKALALHTSLPIIAIPTTYAGSEMTPIWGITENGVKTTGNNTIVKPKTVIYDPELTVTLPADVTVTSGMNAIAHCIEALYAENANPIISTLAEDGIRKLVRSLPIILDNPADLNARADAQYGCWLASTALASVGMALHHKLCHTLGGTFNLPHAATHTVILPHVVTYNQKFAPDAMKAIASAWNTAEENLGGVIFDFILSLQAPISLKKIGMYQQDLAKATELTTKNPYYNPRPIKKEAIAELLNNAYEGKRPSN
ncbi:maleylacetate reductase [Psychrobacillus sp. OK032]|uniref:maleylacetate reductase n=1 Tax=Psychrobacillus sp. OK032 TaxID=1884358 RepID=UPI0008CFC77F|nr:maleylacetate reductase [Psychrobacillus sp. OK032]SER79610.1 maleylacetate reductase [Psychrobacillus sp. OK032]